MVCYAEPAFIQSSQLDLRAGMDGPVPAHGNFVVPGVADTAGTAANHCVGRLPDPTDAELRLELPLFLFQTDRVGPGGDHRSVAGDYRNDSTILQGPASFSLDQYPLFSLGYVRFDTYSFLFQTELVFRAKTQRLR